MAKLLLWSLKKQRSNAIMEQARGVAQLVAHAVWDREVAGSSPVAPTINKK